MYFSDSADTKIITTLDGSSSIFSLKYNEHYHSVNGAIQEAMHIYIQNGFNQIIKEKFSVFEMGFGTGLNAFLTCLEAISKNKAVYYFSIDKHPLSPHILQQMNYFINNKQFVDLYHKIAQAPYGEIIQISDHFIIEKQIADLKLFTTQKKFDLVYFDAFSPDTQPELWKTEIFKKIHSTLNPEAILTTYSCKGIVKKALRDAGFIVERLPGPIGKRHIIRAKKIS